MKLKPKRCSFLQTEVNYFECVIDENGIKPDQKKVEAIYNFACANLCDRSSFFCWHVFILSQVYPKFLTNSEPVIDLTRKYAHFKWTDIHQTAFQFIKDSLTLLVYPDSNKPYTLYTDASDTCVCACLTKTCDGEEKPLYYLSHKLSKSQCKWSTVEKEGYVIHFSLQKLDYYLHNADI